MQQFNRLFSRKISHINLSDKTPVACAIVTTFQTHQNILAAAKGKEESIQEKNSRMLVQNLKYRSQLKNKQTALQQKSTKNRKQMISKIIKSEELRGKMRKNIFERHTEIQSKHLKQRVKSFRETNQNMQAFWSNNEANIQKKYRSQSAVKPLYSDAVERKKSLQERQVTKSQLLMGKLASRLHGREQLVYNLIDQKQKTIHQIHNQKLINNLQKHQELLKSKVNSHINKIGSRFDLSSQLLDKKKKTQNKKIQDHVIDEFNKKSNIKSNMLDRFRHRSASLANCRCLKINNAEELSGFKTSNKNSLMINSAFHSNKSRTKDQIQKNKFAISSQSFFSSVLYNKQSLREKQYTKDTERLQRQKQINEALALRQMMKIQSNCLVRRNSVK